jgi:16S rRNA C967 or C1407 C5-methylase (RsmB/RsmF family)
MTDDVTEDRELAAAAPAKGPYVKPYLRVLDLEASAGGKTANPSETTTFRSLGLS